MKAVNMKKFVQNQHGSFIVEVILGVLILAAVGATVYSSQLKASSATKARQAAGGGQKTGSASATVTPGTPNAAAEYSGWKTYISSNEGLTFRYPSTWKIDIRRESVNDNGDKSDTATVISPSGLALQFIASASGLGGGCGDGGCPTVQTYAAEKIAGTGAPTDLFYVDGSIKSNASGDPLRGKYVPRMGLIGKTEGTDIPVAGKVVSDDIGYYFTAPKKNKSNIGYVMFQFVPDPSKMSNGGKWSYDTEAKVKAFFDTPDAVAAKQIFKSVKY